ncbi:MAG: hypothetical protein WCF61_14190 [Terriglobales bacterium]
MNRKTCFSILALVFLAFAFWMGCGSSSAPAAPAISITATAGTPQSATVDTAFKTNLQVTVMKGTSPVSGAVVTFAAPATGASGTFAGATNTATATTSSSGVAASPAFTANTTAGSYTVMATVSGVTASANFSLTNTAGAPASITATSGGGQSATVGEPFTNPLVATVVDSYRNPVSGAVVTFAAPATGASGTFAGATNTATATTSSSGVAASPAFTANTTAGPYTVMATVPNVATGASFSLTNTAGAPASITATSGGGQSATVGEPFANPLVATVLDSYSNPVSGAVVTFAAPATGASGTFAGATNTATATTNSIGVATSPAFTANMTAGPYTVMATVPNVATGASFSLTNIAANTYTYVFYLNGLEVINGPGYYALAGSVTFDANGNVLTGEQDYNDGNGITATDTIEAASAALTVDPTTGQGTLTLTTADPDVGNNGVETLAVQFVNANHALVAQFDGTATSSGSLDLQTATTASGSYAFTLSGIDNNYEAVVYGGVFSISSGAVTGVYDVDDFGAGTTPTLGTVFTGTVTAPDSFGRGTVTFLPALGGYLTTLAYYNVGPEAMRLIDVDTADSAAGSAFGQGTATFTNASLGASVFGVEANSWGVAYAAAGQFTTDGNGNLTSGIGDDDEDGSSGNGETIGGTYSISNEVGGTTYNGYGSLTLSPALQSTSVLGIYLTDPALNLNDPNNTTGGGGALVADLDGFTLNGTGVLTPQTDTATADFTGSYAFGAQDYNTGESDFVGQGSATDLVLTGTGLLSDPLFYFGSNPTDSGVPFSGTAIPYRVSPGRYRMNPLVITVVPASPVDLRVVIYQASGGQLFWLDKDTFSVFLGPIEQQGSLNGVPGAKKAVAKSAKAKQKQ